MQRANQFAWQSKSMQYTSRVNYKQIQRNAMQQMTLQPDGGEKDDDDDDDHDDDDDDDDDDDGRL